MTRKDFLATLGTGTLAANGLRGAGDPKPGAAAGAPAGETNLNELLCLDDFEEHARRLMPPSVYAYISGGAADELTLGWNRERYRDLRLQAKALIDVSRVDCTTTLFGQSHSMPILVAPTSNHRIVRPEGDLATVGGAGLAGATMVVSSGANPSFEVITRVATQPFWFQLYVAK